MRSTWLTVLAVVSIHATARAGDGPPGATPVQPALPSPAVWAGAMPDLRSWPEEIDADDGQNAPVGYTAVGRARKGLIIGGGITLGVGYLYSAAIASQPSQPGTLWIPIVGAFIELDRTEDPTGKVLMAAIGGAQVVGTLMLYYGLTTTKRVFVRSDLAGSLTVTPLAGTGAQGLALSGRF